MAKDAPVTAAQHYRATHSLRRRLMLLLGGAMALAVAAVIAIGIWAVIKISGERTPLYADSLEHFKYGSIGSEPESGLPLAIWKALPVLFPERFDGRQDYAAFGLLYETEGDGERRDLPIGLATRTINGVELAWLNCAVCHTGEVTPETGGAPQIIAGMPANRFDLYGFIAFLLDIADSEKLAPEPLLAAMEQSGTDLGPLDRLFWRYLVLPRVREGLLAQRAALSELIAGQPAWGPGRVDTFNPYKVLQFGRSWAEFTEAERIGVADFPSIFLQGPRDGMELHWDGNNSSLKERNLSAAIGAGVTPETVDHVAIERVAEWLLDLSPPPSPYRPDPALVEEGATVYQEACAACHGYRSGDRYVFKGESLGKVEPIGAIGTDPARLDSYTAEMPVLQSSLFADDAEHRFRHFRKTDGYANMPLDALWLRAPYLHNGSVPTLADLLELPGARPKAFTRGLTTLDPERGGFAAPPCAPGEALAAGWCFDTSVPGNRNSGHLYGVSLAPGLKQALLAYLLTF
jgi:mono/diheme cytochrome c family protein